MVVEIDPKSLTEREFLLPAQQKMIHSEIPTISWHIFLLQVPFLILGPVVGPKEHLIPASQVTATDVQNLPCVLLFDVSLLSDQSSVSKGPVKAILFVSKPSVLIPTPELSFFSCINQRCPLSTVQILLMSI